VHGDENDRPIGEIGNWNSSAAFDWCFVGYESLLTIDYQGSRDMGSLCFDGPKTCHAIYTRLSSMVGRSIKEIGDVDLSNLL
jgi:hypothetical protein